MKIKVITSTHSSINVGMVGEAIERPDMKGFEVTFKLMDLKVPGIKKKQDITIFMCREEFEVLI